MKKSFLVICAIGAIAMAYLHTITTHLNFDALMYSIIVEGDYTRGFVDTNRLLYTAFVRLIYLAMEFVGLKLRAVYILQLLSITSAVGVIIGVAVWLKDKQPQWMVGLLCLLMGATHVWWRFSSDPHSHIVSLLPLMFAFLSWAQWLSTGQKRFFYITGVLWFLSIIFHQSNVIAGLVLLMTSPGRKTIGLIVGVGLVTFLSYVASAAVGGHLTGMSSFISFLLGKAGGETSYQFSPLLYARTIGTALFASPVALILLGVIFGFLRIKKRDHHLTLALFWLGVYGVFFLIFEPRNIYLKVFLVPPLFILIGELLPRRFVLPVGIIIAAILILHVPGEYRRMSDGADPEKNPTLVQVKQIAAMSTPADLFIVTTQPNEFFNFYLVIFGSRTTAPIDVLFTGQSDRALPQLQKWIEATRARGGTVFFTDEAIQAGSIPDKYRNEWRAFLHEWTLNRTSIEGLFAGHQPSH